MLTFNPSSNLANSTTYTAALSSNITDGSGNHLTATSWQFTTQTGDTTPPTVTSESPTGSGVAVDVNVTATFSENVTYSNGDFTVTPSGGSPISGALSYNSSTHVLTFNPSSNLANSTTYTAALSANITDGSGNHLAATTWQFTTQSGGGGGGSPLATMSSPTPGSTLSGSTVTFTWNPGTSALQYYLYVGTSTGSSSIYSSSEGTSLSDTVSNIPTNGSTVYVRLWTRLSSGWQYNDYTYVTGNGGGGGGGGSPLAIMSSPTPGSTLSGSTVTFTWNPGTSALQYYLYVGTSTGSSSIYSSSEGTSLSDTVSNIPTNGSTVYVRLWTRLSSGWQYNDYTYTASH